MGKTIGKRVSDSFADEGSAAQAKEYSEKVYTTWKDISATLSRNTILIFLLAAIFELLTYQRSSATILIGGFAFANAPIVQFALPAIVAFMLYDGYRLTTRWLDVETAYRALVKIYAEMQSDNDLDIFIRPYLPSLWNVGTSTSRGIADKADNFIYPVNIMVSGFMIFILPIAFECQAYYRLIHKFGSHDFFLWASAAITLLFLCCIAIYAWLYNRNT